MKGGVGILPVALSYRNWDRLQPDGSFGLYADRYIYEMII